MQQDEKSEKKRGNVVQCRLDEEERSTEKFRGKGFMPDIEKVFNSLLSAVPFKIQFSPYNA